MLFSFRVGIYVLQPSSVSEPACPSCGRSLQRPTSTSILVHCMVFVRVRKDRIRTPNVSMFHSAEHSAHGQFWLVIGAHDGAEVVHTILDHVFEGSGGATSV